MPSVMLGIFRYSYNRTSVELKLISAAYPNMQVTGYNRTSVELKRGGPEETQ